MKRITTMSLLLSPALIFASHFTGGEINYTHLGGNNYFIELDYFYDCNSSYPPSSTVYLDLISSSCGITTTTAINLESGFPVVVPTSCPSVSTTCSGGSFPGIRHYRYSGITTFSCQASDWEISFTHCCRNAAISNLQNPVQDVYLETTLDNLSFSNNSSAFAALVPFFTICQGSLTNLNVSAIDPDGDSLSYTLNIPRSAASVNFIYAAGFSSTNPFGTGQTVTLNSFTGDLSIQCNNSVISAIGILISEYRNGVLIATTQRDFQVSVLPCGGNSNPQLSGLGGASYSSSTANTTIMAGDTLTMQIFGTDANTFDILEMSWNSIFGVSSASYSITGNLSTNPVGTFQWTTTCSDASSAPYCFSVNLTDDACPINGSEKRTYCINVKPYPDVIYNNKSTYCKEDSSILMLPSYLGGVWSADCNNCIDSISGILDLQIAGTGNHQISYKLMTNCTTVFDSVDIEVVDIIIDNSISDWIICDDSCSGLLKVQAHSTNSSSINYSWSNGSNNSLIDSLCENIYFMTLTNSLGCSNLDSFEVIKPKHPVIHADDDQYFCEPNETRRSIYIDSSNGGPLNYLWNEVSGGLTNTFSFDSDTLFSVYVIDNKGCTSNVDTIRVYINLPFSSFEMTNEEIPTYNDLIFLSCLNNEGLIFWSWSMIMEDGVQQIGIDSIIEVDLTTLGINRNIGLVQEKEIRLKVIDFAGCEHDTSIFIKFLDQDELFIPNSFTPDNDGLNETYGPISKYDMSEYSFNIFDRWGDLLFSSSSIDNRWDGLSKGSKLSQGNYIWKLNYTLKDKDEPQELIGDVRLLRKR